MNDEIKSADDLISIKIKKANAEDSSRNSEESHSANQSHKSAGKKSRRSKAENVSGDSDESSVASESAPSNGASSGSSSRHSNKNSSDKRSSSQSSSSNSFEPNDVLLPYIASAITGFGRLYNGYEVKGIENVPREGGALIVMYHGLVPIDFWYLGLTLYQELGRKPCALVDRWLMKTPGLKHLTKAVGGVVGERDVALKVLREGALVGVSPGGVKEAVSGPENNYRLMWGGRMGFAQLAIDAGVPIIPGFTQNIESAYKSPMGGLPVFKKLYEKTKLPLVPIVGLGVLPFPVKLTTWLGAPIVPQEGQVAADIVEQTRASLELLMRKHQ